MQQRVTAARQCRCSATVATNTQQTTTDSQQEPGSAVVVATTYMQQTTTDNQQQPGSSGVVTATDTTQQSITKRSVEQEETIREQEQQASANAMKPIRSWCVKMDNHDGYIVYLTQTDLEASQTEVPLMENYENCYTALQG